jgi:hypothetical protein
MFQNRPVTLPKGLWHLRYPAGHPFTIPFHLVLTMQSNTGAFPGPVGDVASGSDDE